jgi:hypothetical protein
MALTAKERQARYRASWRDRRWVALCVIVPARTAHELQLMTQALRARDGLEVGPLRDLRSGRLISAKTVLRRDGDDGGSP